MRRTRIQVAMDAGKQWAEQQLKKGIEVTPSTVEEAANKTFKHMGSRHLFCCSALERTLLHGTAAEETGDRSIDLARG